MHDPSFNPNLPVAFVSAALSTLPAARFAVLGLCPHANLDPAAPL
jgi:hypothetical protein